MLDLARIVAGPYCSMLLGDLGADVIKIEPPGGDELRRWGPPFAGSTAAYFLCANRNKRSLVLDLHRFEDRAHLAALVKEADVVVHNYTERVSRKLGIDSDWLAEQNPRCVICRVSGFPDGSERAAYDLVLQAASGLMAITGQPEGPPTKVGVAVADASAGLFSALAVMAKLLQGGGGRVEVSLLDAALALLLNQGAAWLAGAPEPRRLGNDHPNIAPYGTFATADGELVLGVGSGQQFRSLCGVLQLEQLPDRAEFATNPQRVAHREELRSLLEAQLRFRSAEEWSSELQAVGVPCGLVNSVGQALSGVGRHLIAQLRSDDGSSQAQLMSPIRLDGDYLRPYRAAPSLETGAQQLDDG